MATRGSEMVGAIGDPKSFFNWFSTSIKTSVSDRKLWTAAKYAMRFCGNFCEAMTSSTLKEAHDMSWPNISRYVSFSNAIDLRSKS